MAQYDCEQNPDKHRQKLKIKAADTIPEQKFQEQTIASLQGQLRVKEQENEQLAAALERSFEESNLLHTLGDITRLDQKPTEYLKTICKDLLEVLACEQVMIYWHEAPAQATEVQARPAIFQEGRYLLAGITSEALWQTACTASVDNRQFVIDNDYSNNNPQGKQIRNFILTPIIANNMLLGAIVALNKNDSRGFSNLEARLTRSVVNKLSISYENQSLYIRQRELMLGTLCALVRSIDAKDPYTCGHSERVAGICRFLAEKMELSETEIENAYMAGLLHDIGKIGVRGSTLRKDQRLTDEEFDEIKKHPEIGAGILNGIKQISEVVSGVMTHHERYDGKGYPFGLSSNNIPLIGRIVNIADTFDAMISSRPYRKSLPVNEVLYEISRFSGTQFDPMIAEVLLKCDLDELLNRIINTENGIKLGNEPKGSLRTKASQILNMPVAQMLKESENIDCNDYADLF
ncbi:MAG: HD domain-containing protein [Sedimentisphaerales bacterium]|nr:HD domain-containing protein [Sedimentisphaerales bacterium]MBN2843403.1 HD domain-containing protein [Sedimentisphaerales bacterium]